MQSNVSNGYQIKPQLVQGMLNRLFCLELDDNLMANSATIDGNIQLSFYDNIGQRFIWVSLNEVDFFWAESLVEWSKNLADKDRELLCNQISDCSADWVKYLLENDSKDYLDNEIDIFFNRRFKVAMDRQETISKINIENSNCKLSFEDLQSKIKNTNDYYNKKEKRNEQLEQIVLDYQLNNQPGSQE